MILSGLAMLRCPHPDALRRFFAAVFHRRRPAVLFCCLICFLSACAPQPRVATPDPDFFATLSGKLRSKAVEYEKAGDLRQALLHWWILQSLNPRDKEIAARVERLKQETRAKAAEHFQQGVVFYQKNLPAKARREFLYTLTYEQDHLEALDYLQNRLHDNVFITYQVQQGDTGKEIARKVYHDPDKQFLVAAFNNVNRSGELSPGTELRLVVLAPDPGRSGKVADSMPQQEGEKVLAPGPRKRKGVEDAYSRGESDVASETQAVEGGANRNALQYRQAKELLDRQEYVEALRILRRIDAKYRDVGRLIAAAEVSVQQEADAHYRKGVSYYLSEDLDKAIKEWEVVLRLRPDDLKAKKDLLNARRLQEKIKKF